MAKENYEASGLGEKLYNVLTKLGVGLNRYKYK